MDKRNDLRRYGFCEKVPFKSSCENIKEYLDEKLNGISGPSQSEIRDTITSSVNSSMSDIKRGLHNIDRHITHAENHIIDEIHIHANDGCCCCGGGMSENDIETIVARVNQHTDEKFEEVDIAKNFSDLNEQVAEIMDKIK